MATSDPAPTIAVVGAGPGIGAAVARRFAHAGYAVGLVARDGNRLDRMAAEISGETGVRCATATADATVPDQVRRALAAIAADLGDPSVLCFSPIPDVSLIRPVLDTRAEELIASLQLNVAGAAAAVESVLPAMRAANKGSLLFTTGSAALQPSAERAASAVTTTAATVYIALLRQALDGTEVRVGHTVVVGPVDAAREGAHRPDDVAEDLWRHHEGHAEQFPTVLRLP